MSYIYYNNDKIVAICIREDFKKKKKDFRGIAPKGEGGVSDLWSIAPNPILLFFGGIFLFLFGF